uniref:NADH-ubiquinone oxidoreductase chain 2 n=1 Tax=Amblyomma javanense TaxID=1658007 RepID=A0A4Y5UBY2_9ACAR|nr:NADH dehydrogenase subunit 2 [Amblyomma javanense]QDC21268.1 NADH dehydrogenase subunit 2 [Amblyomma javanense]
MLFKNLLKWMIMTTVIITISSKSWFIYWLMMEMNLLMFIPILNSKKKNSSNSMISYFIIQSFSSNLFLFSMLNFEIMAIKFFCFTAMMSIMIKLAIIPFHFWLTNLSEMLDFKSLFLILTIQKVIPLFILSSIKMNILSIFVMISSIFASIFVLNLKSLKKILIFSSISHQSWMIVLMLISSNFWISYMIVYSILIYKITSMLIKINSNYINNLIYTKSDFNIKITFCMMMLSLGGMPPFLGFLMKFISILIIMNSSSMMISILIMSSIINIFIYVRAIMPNLFINLMNTKIYMLTKMNIKNLILNINIMIAIFSMNLMI